MDCGINKVHLELYDKVKKVIVIGVWTPLD